MANAPPIGIDLGSTFTRIGVFRNGKFEIIEYMGDSEIPMYIAFIEDYTLIGHAAEIQSNANPKNTIFDLKNLIGRKYDDPVITAGIKYWPFSVININSNPAVEINYNGEKRRIFPELVLSMFLSKIIKVAEEYLGQKVTDAVISVPSYFKNAQRLAIISIGSYAGLKTIRLINEPSAAAIACYCLDKKKFDEKNLLVLHIGGGNVGASIITIKDNFIDVQSSNGNCNMGGYSFDMNLIELIKSQRVINSDDDHKTFFYRLRKVAEMAKVALTSSQTAKIQLDGLFEENETSFQFSITRGQFEELNADLFHMIVNVVEKAICEAKIDKSNIDDVILVGGSTTIPYIQKKLRHFFDDKVLSNITIPKEAVVYGAAVQAFILHGGKLENIPDLQLIDVASFSLGVKALNDLNNIIIRKNSIIPIEQSFTIALTEIHNVPVEIEIYEGEKATANITNLLERFEVKPTIPLNQIAPANSVIEIEITFEIDQNGLFNLSVLENLHGYPLQVKSSK